MTVVGKAGGDRDDLVARAERALARAVAGERREREQVGAGAGVHEQRVLDAEVVGEPLLERLPSSARR